VYRGQERGLSRKGITRQGDMRETRRECNVGRLNTVDRALLRGPDWDGVSTSKGIPTLGCWTARNVERNASAWTVQAQPDTPPYTTLGNPGE
jgi:hypothetical protein